MVQRIENIGNIIKNEIYNVPCWVTEDGNILPIIQHLHSDKISGQEYPHYHIDDRFISGNKFIYIDNVEHKINKYYLRIYPKNIELNGDNKPGTIKRLNLKCINTFVSSITPVDVLHKHKIKKCMHNGKCPHKGYDLSNIKPVNGIITCPLHGLKINSVTNKVINDPKVEKILIEFGIQNQNESNIEILLEDIKDQYPDKYKILMKHFEFKKQHNQELSLEVTNII